MERRPRINIELSVTDKIIELIGGFGVVIIWVMVITSYSNLPDTIPTHYNAIGEIDGFGNKINILILPLLATVFFVGITILNRFPHIFGYLTTINNDNALKNYTEATKINRYLKLFFVVVFGLLAYKTIQVSGETGALFLPVILGVLVLALFYFIVTRKTTKTLLVKKRASINEQQ
jgi:uncharacterized membrane protein